MSIFPSYFPELEQLCGMSDYSSSNSSNSIENADKLNNNYSTKFKFHYHNQKQHHQPQQQQQQNHLNIRESKKYCQSPPSPLKSILKKPLSSLNTNLNHSNNNQTSGKDKELRSTKFANQPKNSQATKKPSIRLVETEILNKTAKSQPLSIYSTHNYNGNQHVDFSPKLNNVELPPKHLNNQNESFDLSEEFLKANCDIVAKNLDKLYYGPVNYCEKTTKQAQLNRYLYNCCDSLKSNSFFAKASPENKWNFRGSFGKMSSPAECDTTNNNTGQYAPLNCSVASSQDFTHDNSDYQWFVDYG